MSQDLDIQKLQQSVDELNRLVQGSGKGLNDLNKGAKEAEKGAKAMGKAALGQSAAIAKGLGAFGAGLAKGNTDLESFNKVIDVASDAMGAVAKALPVFGDAVAGALKAAAEGAKFLVSQLDATNKSFVELSKTGAAGAQGMTQIFGAANKAGLSLQQYTKVVGENSAAMARFRGLTSDGAEEFTKVVAQINGLGEGSDQTLRKLGLGAEQITEGAAAFLTQQTRLGRARTMSDAELAQGTVRYVKELDLLSKLTGANRTEMQKSMDAALSESRFRAKIDSLVAENRVEEAQQLQLASEQMKQQYGPEAAQGFRDFVAMGAANTDASVKLMNSTGGRLNGILSGIESGALDSKGAVQGMGDGFQEMKSVMIQNARSMGEDNRSFLPYGGKFADGINNITQANKEAVATAKTTQATQIEATDKLTDQTISAQKNLEKMNVNINKLAERALPYAAWAVNKTTEAMNSLVDFVNDEIDGKKKRGGGEGALKGAAVGAAGGAAIGALGGPLGALVGSVIGAGVGGVTGYLGGGGGGGGGKTQRAPGGGGGPTGMSQKDLESMGLKLKKGDVQGEGNQLSPELVGLAQSIQGSIPGFAYFSGFNDQFHNENSPSSKHTAGRAVDFTLAQKPTKEQGAQIVAALKSMGASFALDEYNAASAKATGGHIHAEVSAANGAILSGPTGGYKPNLTMHGTEAIVPLNTPSGSGINSSADPGAGIMSAQLAKMEEMVSVMKNQLSVSSKILAYQS